MFRTLFKTLFGKRPKPPAADTARLDDLDTLIMRAAGTLAPADQQRALTALKGVQLFMNLHRAPDGRLIMPAATLGNGLKAVVLYTTPTHRN